jgi:methylphosphotriester-DNA--protein-cysteine methyltransferase
MKKLTRQQEWYYKNKERSLANDRKWRKENADKVSERNRQYREEFKKKYGMSMSKYYKLKRSGALKKK